MARSEAVPAAAAPGSGADGKVAASFRSILYRDEDARHEPAGTHEPDCFPDLNLDQIVQNLTAGRDFYDLRPYCHLPLSDVDAIAYRHEVFRDLDRREVRQAVSTFADRMRRMRDRLAREAELHHRYQKQRWLLAAISEYCRAVRELGAGLSAAGPASRGFRGLHDYLGAYLESAAFRTLRSRVVELETGLDNVRYRLQIRDTRVAVSQFREEDDYSAEVLATFEKFKQAEADEYRFDLPSYLHATSVEAEILERVALLYPDLFAALTRIRDEHADFLDETIRRFDREIQLYLAVLEHRERMAGAGLPFCYPEVIRETTDVSGAQVYDLALADHLVAEKGRVVANDFALSAPERIVVVTGPNQGGKTTFARAFGQVHYLASLGFPVPARRALLQLPDGVFTHFERQEDLDNQRGKLEDDLVRIRAILEKATARSVLVMNESLAATTVLDALKLGRRVLTEISERGIVCVFVTFLDELSALNSATVSMVSQIDPDDPARRTFRVERTRADGLAYAMAIARKHGLTYDGVRERIVE